MKIGSVGGMQLYEEVCNGMNSQKVDLLIIGAGASGACIAYEAVKRGLKVGLLDQGDIGGGTSCRSTKLLHGGVRYLELAFKNFDLAQLRLVREALIERAYWLEKVPFLSHRLELALPTEGCFGKAYYRVGLGIYDTLSGRKAIGSSRLLQKAELSQALPLLRDGLNGGVAYSDGQFNDARLNLLLALTAEKKGAILRNYCKVVELKNQPSGRLCGATSINSVGKEEYWEASVIVNATGIHSDKLRQMADSSVPTRITTSRGIHLILKENLCPRGIGLLLPSTDDGRVLFLLPFYGHTQVGTTDTPCNLSKANQPSDSEKEYLIKHIKHWFPSLKNLEVSSYWAGGRPLLSPSNNELSSSQVVREHEIETLPCGLISAMGGKWTTCRAIAMDTLKAIELVLKKPLPKAKQLQIIGVNEQPSKTNYLLECQREEMAKHVPTSAIQSKQIAHLQANYGLEALPIISDAPSSQLEPLSNVIPLCEAEIRHSIVNEHAKTANDILSRRCRLSMVDLSEAKRVLPVVNKHLRDAGLEASPLDLKN